MSTPIRVLLNSGFSGPHAWFFLAEERGYFRDEGIAVTLVGGAGAAAVVSDMAGKDCDACYGDLCALVDVVARGPAHQGPVAAYVAFNQTPLTIAVDAAGTIRAPRDLRGKTISGHRRDAALLVFPALARAAGLDATTVTIAASEASLGEQVARMLDGAADGVFGFVNTIIASLGEGGFALEDRVRFIEYRLWMPDLYGNALILGRRLVETRPEDCRRLVRALSRAVMDVIADPDAGIAAVAAHKPDLDIAINRRRLLGTLAVEMAHPERDRLGMGEADPARITRGIEQLVAALALPRRPNPREIFDAAYLPARETRRPATAKPA